MIFPEGAGTEAVLDSLARTLGVGIFVADARGSIVWSNEVLGREFPGIFTPGRPAEDALRDSTAPDRDLLPDPLRELLAQGMFGRPVPDGSLRRRLLENGERRNYRHHAFPVAAAKPGEPGGATLTVHCLVDVTPERKLAETHRTSQNQLSFMKEILDLLYEAITDTREVIHLILVAVTSRLGFGFNRAFFLEVRDDRLRGILGIGPANPEDAHRIWSRLQESNPSLRESQRQLAASGGSPDPATARLAARLDLPLSGPEAEGASIVQAVRRGKAARIFREEKVPAVDDGLFRLLATDLLAVVPLQIGRGLEGVVIADNFITRKAISDDDLSILKTFSGYAGLALERSRLYDELRRNVEQQKAINEELKANQARLLQAEKLSAIGELAAFVSHEIRNPLVAIGGLARSALLDGVEKPETQEALGIIVQEVRRLESFLRETLDFVKPNAGPLGLVDLNRVVRDTLSTFKEELNTHGVEARCELNPAPIPARVDSNLLRGALSNLVKNAIEAMERGGSLRVETIRNGTSAKIRVADTGPGIPPEIRAQIFDLFFTTKKGGTGLGLAMATQSIKSLGGALFMEEGAAERDYRTVFTISLPMADDQGIEAKSRS